MQYGWPAGKRTRAMAVFALLRSLMVLTAALLAALSLQVGTAFADEEFLDPDLAFVMSAAMTAPDELSIHYKIAPKYYMYRERFEVAAAPETASPVLGELVFPAGVVTYDPTFDKEMEVYYHAVTMRLRLARGDAQPLTLAITGQGCADAGLCYPPMTRHITLTPTGDGYAATGQGVVASVPEPRSQDAARVAASAAQSGDAGLGQALKLSDVGFADYLSDAGWLQVILLCLLLGLLLSFTPCVLPMVPILLAVLAGDKAGAGRPSRMRGFTLAATFVLGMSLVYTALGIAAGLIGASMAIWLQTPWVLSLFAVLLALLALAMFDVFTVQAPVGMQSALNAWMARIPGGRYGGVFVMGMVSALIVGPCIAAPLAGVLLFISQTGDVVLGGTALFALAWGEGLLLLVVGATSGLLLPKAGPWMEGVKRLFGILLLATAWWMVNSILPTWIVMLGWAVLALWSAAMLGAFEAIGASGGTSRYLAKALGVLLAVWATALVVGVAAGSRDLLRPLAPLMMPAIQGSGANAGLNATGAAIAGDPAEVRARFTQVSSVQELDQLLASTTRPVMLDFYADWCVSCIEMERFTFSEPTVAGQMSQMLLVQADVTNNTEADRELLKRFRLFGPPGIVFFDAEGRLIEGARVVGFQNAGDFSDVLAAVLSGR